ncbi:DNA-binding transcriptional regulator, MarR family [Nonomuraea solani]|uniref:DNA-binding transcriptional regulator, MarR family n=1 Tax=Nonomuraea solani TaxID=1144553 RepID=A0A1H5UGJ2_9ACTN|nr:MarR family transcriptional regulator [Nonomuraea solani]SEF73397.1 DNA-binding transcriptional regulator, MarR family [Nonomuraea solani]
MSSADDDQILAVMPRLAQLGTAISRGRLTEHAMDSAGVGVDRPAFSVLVTLHLTGKPLRISEIAERMQLVQPHVTRQVQQLERHGLVRRTGDPNDRRVSFIEPTDEGRVAAERYARTLIGWFTGAIAHWSEQDRADLGRLLARFADDVTARLATLEDT